MKKESHYGLGSEPREREETDMIYTSQRKSTCINVTVNILFYDLFVNRDAYLITMKQERKPVKVIAVHFGLK